MRPGERWLEFARRLRSRYGLARTRGDAPPITLLRQRRWLRQVVESRTLLVRECWEAVARLLRPSVRLGVNLTFAPVSIEKTAYAPAPVLAVRSRKILWRTQPAREALRQPAPVVGRELASRLHRVEQRITHSHMVVTRPAPAVPSPQAMATVAAREPRMTSPAPVAAPWTAPPQAALPSFQVEQITDNVLCQLDRRVTAWRERRGRA